MSNAALSVEPVPSLALEPMFIDCKAIYLFFYILFASAVNNVLSAEGSYVRSAKSGIPTISKSPPITTDVGYIHVALVFIPNLGMT